MISILINKRLLRRKLLGAWPSLRAKRGNLIYA